MHGHLCERVIRLSLLAYFVAMTIAAAIAFGWLVVRLWPFTGISLVIILRCVAAGLGCGTLLYLPSKVLRLLPGGRNGPTARLKRGLCQNCGFDLRATPAWCPECGAPLFVDPRTGAPYEGRCDVPALAR